jgi:hypothetical protein
MTDVGNSANAAASTRSPDSRDRRSLGSAALVFSAIAFGLVAVAMFFRVAENQNDYSGLGGTWFFAGVAEAASVVVWLCALAVTAIAGLRIRPGIAGRRRTVAAFVPLVLTPLAWFVSAQMS